MAADINFRFTWKFPLVNCHKDEYSYDLDIAISDTSKYVLKIISRNIVRPDAKKK